MILASPLAAAGSQGSVSPRMGPITARSGPVTLRHELDRNRVPIGGGKAQSSPSSRKPPLAEFVGDVIGAVAPDEDCWLPGPFHAPAEPWSRIPFYIGHLTTPGTDA